MEKGKLCCEEVARISHAAYGYFRIYDLDSPRSWIITDTGNKASREAGALPVITAEERQVALKMRDEAFAAGLLRGSWGDVRGVLYHLHTAEWYSADPADIESARNLIPGGPMEIEVVGLPIEADE